ncbi:PucR family transcriptional regulator ligand-binding domain-containing protein [Streptomyces sp. NPDC060194]|uniref:PucR family transcriptional regulator ligand-binding domain-containing protein n=1 Tax=Streptomyces sp. NPDC060194 TaxID=3347069 RepID=UPI003646D48A
MPARPDATPPTPAVALAALLARDDLGLRQVGGPPVAADDAVHWVHTSEMADPYPYLLGGELLLTAGVSYPPDGAAGAGDPWDAYVRRLVEAGGAALGFGVVPVHDTVPDALVAACDRYGLPLVEVPPPTPFTAVARAVWGLMAEARHRELREVARAQQALAAAASRPDAVPEVLRVLAARLGGWAALLAPDGTAPHTAGRTPGPAARSGLRRLAEVVSPEGAADVAPASASDHLPDGTHLAAYALGGDPSGAPGPVLAVTAPRRAPGDHTIAGVGAVLLTLLTAERQGADEAGRTSALVRLLLGDAPAAVAPLLGEGPWTVVHGHGTGAPPPLGTSLVDPTADGFRALLPAGAPLSAHPGWALGASAPAAAEALPTAGTQAVRAVRRARATRTPLVRHRTTGLDALTDPDEAAAYAAGLLAPLTPALQETLRTWLSLHGNWDRTAAALSVHRNTVRQRIGRCTTLLDRDLDDMTVRADLWFALRHR